jgi:mercuric ion transport protein
MTIKEQHRPANLASAETPAAGPLVAAVAVLAAVAASSCCILPVVLFGLGASGAWIGNLTALAPYQPYLLATTIAALGYGYWLVYRRTRVGCSDGAACARPLSNRLMIAALVLATVLVAAAIGVNVFTPILL